MERLRLSKALKITICLVFSILSVMFSFGSASAETKEEIYNSHDELKPFTDPELFMERYALRKDKEFDPDEYEFFFYNFKSMITVGSDNVLQITEFIDAYFNTPHHGIYRTLPLFNKVVRNNGLTTLNTCRISGIYTNTNSTIKYRDEDVYIQLGDPDTMVTGFQSYRIQYTYDLGKDPLTDRDEFFFDLIGTDFACPTLRAEFEIELPKRFDASQLHFFTGYAGSEEESLVDFEVNGNTITGGTNAFLNNGEALTCYLRLPEGYFADAHTNYDHSSLITLGIVTVMLIVCVALFLFSRSRNRYTLYAEFAPPRGLNPVEAAYVKYGSVTNAQIVSLLPYLASKGYISIKELSKGGALNSANCGFMYTSLLPYDGDKQDEKLFYRGLFGNLSGEKRNKKDPDAPPSRKTIFDNDLKNRFYLTIDKIQEHIRSSGSRYSDFYVRGGTKMKMIYRIILTLFGGAAIALPLSFDGPHILENFDMGTFLVFAVMAASFIFFLTMLGKIGKAILGVMAGLFTLLMYSDTKVFLASDIAEITSLSVSYILTFVYMGVHSIRSDYGKELYGRLMGFERYIKNTSAADIDLLCRTDPQYYYDIIPFAYALGFNNRWDKYFRSLSSKQPPDWYDCNYFETGFTMSNMDYMMRSSTTEMVSSPGGDSGSSGGGFSSGGSGGGSSGGGSGGGGAGAW